jgi:hypothetical protein
MRRQERGKDDTEVGVHLDRGVSNTTPTESLCSITLSQVLKESVSSYPTFSYNSALYERHELAQQKEKDLGNISLLPHKSVS